MNIMYDLEIQKMVVVLYGKNSNIYTAMINGEKISRLIKQSLKVKGSKIFRIKDKKSLCEKCKTAEQKFEELSEVNNVF